MSDMSKQSKDEFRGQWLLKHFPELAIYALLAVVGYLQRWYMLPILGLLGEATLYFRYKRALKNYTKETDG